MQEKADVSHQRRKGNDRQAKITTKQEAKQEATQEAQPVTKREQDQGRNQQWQQQQWQQQQQQPRRGQPFRIFLIRHGESVANADPCVYETTADHKIPLTREGRRMARDAGLALRQKLESIFNTPEAAGPISMWVSPFLRTRETAKEIVQVSAFLLWFPFYFWWARGWRRVEMITEMDSQVKANKPMFRPAAALLFLLRCCMREHRNALLGSSIFGSRPCLLVRPFHSHTLHEVLVEKARSHTRACKEVLSARACCSFVFFGGASVLQNKTGACLKALGSRLVVGGQSVKVCVCLYLWEGGRDAHRHTDTDTQTQTHRHRHRQPHALCVLCCVVESQAHASRGVAKGKSDCRPPGQVLGQVPHGRELLRCVQSRVLSLSRHSARSLCGRFGQSK